MRKSELILKHINKIEELAGILNFLINKFCESRKQCITQIKNLCEKELIYKYLIDLNNIVELTKKVNDAIRWEAFNIVVLDNNENKNITITYHKMINMNDELLNDIINYRDIIENIYNL